MAGEYDPNDLFAPSQPTQAGAPGGAPPLAGPQPPTAPPIADDAPELGGMPRPPQEEGPLDDIGNSFVSGLPKGLVRSPGMGGDIRHLLSQATDYIGSQFGASPEAIQKIKDSAHYASMLSPVASYIAHAPTSDQMQGAAEGVLGTKFYEPKTGLGKVANATGEFLGNPASYLGAGSLPLKAATAASAGAGSEMAGQAAEALGGEGMPAAVARIAGAVVAGKIPHKVAQAQFRKLVKNATSTEELFDSADFLYDMSRTTGVEIKASALSDLATKIKTDLHAEGYRRRNVGSAFDAIDELHNLTNRGSANIGDIQSARRLLNKVANSKVENAAQEREAARFAMAEINKFMGSVAPADILSGTPKAVQEAVQSWRTADKAYAAGMRAEQLEDALTAAIDRAKSTGKGTNVDNAMRQNLRSIINSKVKSRGFTPEEVSKMRDIVRGEAQGNSLRALGALAPTGIVSGTLGLEAGKLLFGKAGMIGAPFAGHIAKKLADKSTANKIEDLIAGVRLRGSGVPIPQKPPVGMPAGSLTTLSGALSDTGDEAEDRERITRRYMRELQGDQ